jgi:hypothetical protein
MKGLARLGSIREGLTLAASVSLVQCLIGSLAKEGS